MKKIKIKKIISWWIDFLVYVFGVLLFFQIFCSIVPISINIQIILAIFSIIIIYLLYSRKDILFNGRSLGKRIFSLAVYNELGTELVDNQVLKKRGNIEMFTFPLDFWFLLFLDKQVADYVCKTDVMEYKKRKID